MWNLVWNSLVRESAVTILELLDRVIQCSSMIFLSGIRLRNLGLIWGLHGGQWRNVGGWGKMFPGLNLVAMCGSAECVIQPGLIGQENGNERAGKLPSVRSEMAAAALSRRNYHVQLPRYGKSFRVATNESGTALTSALLNHKRPFEEMKLFLPLLASEVRARIMLTGWTQVFNPLAKLKINFTTGKSLMRAASHDIIASQLSHQVSQQVPPGVNLHLLVPGMIAPQHIDLVSNVSSASMVNKPSIIPP
ncbi:uncharacterized protein BDR25DRAFT_351535 [Lindgomyces ingoldianus]|uniref:Uncharacterized protein n=1 Tax=Lindgomyces ingoldianus TaxID=673940 RepID=A0ACB6R9Q4_9PLEO|nr:uncharacterized protein BDR25DRAFT_351535 [Lindgomyces ingoldianus]KAF2475057.1 hypothetical protein BDR25DRAFT_351535 [Lindgomyces ingoldianus]